MNFKMIRYILGNVLKAEGVMLLLPAVVGLLYQEKSTWAFLLCAFLCFLTGFFLSFKKPKNPVFYATEGYVSVALCWLAMSLFGALPFVVSSEIPSFTNALFETVSGFTTTGASILSDVEALSHCMLFWRSFTHWIGGMGVLVFILTILPLRTGSHVYLMKAESPGPSVEKLVPKIQNTSLILYGIYSALTLLEMILLFATGMPLFDAVTISFGTAGTGGFAVKNSGLADYAPHLQNIVTVFMILFGVNFNIYFLILIRRWKSILKSEEIRLYLGIILASVVVITGYIYNIYGSLSAAVRHAAFQVGSIITTTGFSTTDFNTWPAVPKVILVTLMFVGACAGSTGGGIKVSRLIIFIKSLGTELFHFSHPHGVKKVKMDGNIVSDNVTRSVHTYMAAYILIFVFSLLLISLDNMDFESNFTAIAATFNNIGPGLSAVGPTQNFGFFSNPSKFVMIFDMLAGRLELFPMLILFSPYTYKRC